MEVQTTGSENNVQQSHLQPSQLPLLARQNSWYNLTFDELQNQLGGLGKSVGNMSLDELLKNIWSKQESQNGGRGNASSVLSLQRQASLTLARALTGKTVDDVWREIQQGQMKRYGGEMKSQNRILTLGEMSLEDFLVQAGLFAEATIAPSMGMDNVDAVTPQSFSHQMTLSSSPSLGTMSDTTTTTSGRKRDAPDALEKTLERRLRRKIKNRESAARSRARKQVLADLFLLLHMVPTTHFFVT